MRRFATKVEQKKKNQELLHQLRRTPFFCGRKSVRKAHLSIVEELNTAFREELAGIN